MEFFEFKDDTAMYEKLNEYLLQGFRFEAPVGLSPVLTDGKRRITLSYGALPETKELWLPDFEDCFLNVISAIRKNFGYDSEYVPSFQFKKEYKKLVVLLLDGLGINIINNNLPEDSFLRSHIYKSIHAVYPSTTAAATTAIKSGKSPYETGWTGWENWFSEKKENIILFNGKNNITEEKTDITGFKVMPYSYFFSDMKDVRGLVIEPDFSKEDAGIADVLNRSLQENKKKERQVQYVYYTEPDELMHSDGAYADSVKRLLGRMDKAVKKYASMLQEDTLLIITADHGHTNVKPVHLYNNKRLYEMLEHSPSNDARCITFKVKEGKKEEFVNYFNGLYQNIYRLYTKEEVIRDKMMGYGEKHSRIDDFLGDYVAMAISNYYFQYKPSHNFDFRSHHAGITRDEMEVPVILYEH